MDSSQRDASKSDVQRRVDPPPIPDGLERWALFLDFDGTLTDFAPTPAEVSVPTTLPSTLNALRASLGGALALISGRPLTELDAFLAPASLPGAGLHGAELRDISGTVRRHATPPSSFGAIRAALQTLVDADPRLLLEDKGLTLALHYKRAPQRQADCLSAVRSGLEALPGYVLLDGKDVFELKPAAASKSSAIESFMLGPPFAGRKPVFAGDDVTDEDGFGFVNEHGGLSIKVGPGATQATSRCATVAEFRHWLERLQQRLSTLA